MIVVFAESDGGRVKKSSLEAISFGQDLASALQTECVAVAVGSGEFGELGQYGAQKTIVVNGDGLDTFTPEGYSKAIFNACERVGASVVVIPSTYSGKCIAPKLAIKLGASCVSGVVSLPDVSNGFSVRKTCFSNKAFTSVEISSDKKVLGLIPNSYEVKSYGFQSAVENISAVGLNIVSKSLEINKIKGKIALTEAELVVSAGRGLKGPENWDMVEELADLLGAATACSKPVADMDWRPHGEHVGQTGITIKPNLYIAIGISGAIQHLAGVSSSKVICVINTDAEAPFFKAADYGIVGDAFDVVPKLIARLKQIKGS